MQRTPDLRLTIAHRASPAIAAEPRRQARFGFYLGMILSGNRCPLLGIMLYLNVSRKACAG
jgi:hypothetical protein